MIYVKGYVRNQRKRFYNQLKLVTVRSHFRHWPIPPRVKSTVFTDEQKAIPLPPT